ncbi:TIM-barrel domain-containing protein [Escherichia coli]
MIELGCGGWMADFGEYLPTDTYLHNGISAEIMHNAWPALWAKCNYEALKKRASSAILFFMRAGSTGSQKYSTMMWAGDQNVDWSLDDGLASVVPAALSLAMTGHGLHHSDIGGYTTLFEMKRSKELLLRWCGYQRLHADDAHPREGNRPGDNWQFDGDAETIAHFARMTTVFTTLKPYLKEAVALNAKSGLPVMRPLFLHYEDDAQTYSLKYRVPVRSRHSGCSGTRRRSQRLDALSARG